jgi:rhodanese-related sulfurtransferase
MVEQIDHAGLLRLLDEGAQLVDVLPREEYDQFHIRGAASVPLKELREDSVGELNKDGPVIVYCHDSF